MSDFATAFRLDGKTALVTGAAQGIGAEICAVFAQAGARVLATDIKESEGNALAVQIKGNGGVAEFRRHDVANEDDWKAVMAAAVATFGGLDILVNNAGIETAALLSECAVDDFRRILEVNVIGVFLGIKHAISTMSAQGAAGRGGSIVNMSSIAAMIGSTAHAAYHTSKGAVRALTKAAAIECATLGTGIRVNSVHPGIVRTEMGTGFIQHLVDLKLLPDYARAEAVMTAAHPMGLGEPRDVASAVLYLASDASRWSTGSELVLDGGYTAA
jgi:NAD(P)-dependent dehydrogenase (short-subunit alcohol dehydrogenase family)